MQIEKFWKIVDKTILMKQFRFGLGMPEQTIYQSQLLQYKKIPEV